MITTNFMLRNTATLYFLFFCHFASASERFTIIEETASSQVKQFRIQFNSAFLISSKLSGRVSYCQFDALFNNNNQTIINQDHNCNEVSYLIAPANGSGEYTFQDNSLYPPSQYQWFYTRIDQTNSSVSVCFSYQAPTHWFCLADTKIP